MAGDAFSRFKTQVLIFFSVKVRKQFDTSTQAGRTRLMYFVGIVALLLFAAVTFSDGGMESELVTANERGAFGGGMAISGGALGSFDDDDDDSDDSGGGGGGGLDDDGEEEEEEDSDADADGDEEEEDEDGGSSRGMGGGSSSEAESEAASLRAEQQARQADMKSDFTSFFQAYKGEDEVHDFLQSYVDKYHEVGIISAQSIGQTYEKRNLDVYVLGKGDRHIVILGSEHGSEWSVPMYLSYIVSRLTLLYGINDDVTNVLKSLKLHVIPVLNPDGMAYTFKSKSHDARNYMKNRAPIRRHSSVKGVDFRDDWASFSQSEPKAVREYLNSLKDDGLSAFVTVQCCSGLVTYPLNKTCIRSNALDEQVKVGQQIAEKMSSTKTYSTVMQAKPSKHSSKSHPTDLSISWAQNQLGLSLSYTFGVAKPLPPAGKKSRKSSSKSSDKKAIIVPEEDIVGDSKDVAQGIVALAKHLLGEFRRPSAFCNGAEEAATSSSGNSASSDDDEEEEAIPKGGEDEDEEEDEEPREERSDDDEEEMDEEEDVDDDSASADEDEDADEDDTANDDPDRVEEAEDDDVADADEGDDDGGLPETDDAAIPESKLRGFNPGEDMELSEKDRRDYEMSKRFAQMSAASGASSSSLSSRQSSSKHLSEEMPGSQEDVQTALKYARGGASMSQMSVNDDEHFLYFAYGPDMLFDVLYVSGITSAVKVAVARLEGFTYDYSYLSKRAWKSGVADLIPVQSGAVFGVVYRIDRSQREVLDRHNLASSETSSLKPVRVRVRDARGNEHTCITYKVASLTAGDDIQHKYKRYKPSRQYRNCVIKGAKMQGLPEEYIERSLRSISALYSDKTGSTTHRNYHIGSICDHTTSSSSSSSAASSSTGGR